MNNRAFGELLRDFRFAAGLSQEELAERARLSPGAISSLERAARRAPQHQTLGLLTEALRLDEEQRAQLEAAAQAGRHRTARGAAAIDKTSSDHNLPKPLTSFHGRSVEVAELARLMESRRLITLLGPGGVGKTRLALEAARAQTTTSAFPDGIRFVDLASLGVPQLVTGAIARLLNVREQLNTPLLDTLVAAIGKKHLLLVLDNCEHVLSECAVVAERLSNECSEVTVLATTREALRIDGECVVRVEPLAYEDGPQSAPALDLFIDRLVEADYARYSQLTSEHRVHAAAICKRLDGIPLAIELAAGRARDLGLAQILAGLDERFTLLAQGRRTASPRHHTLRGTIDWSFALLTEPERQLFARLGIFAQAFTPEAAAEICSDGLVPVRDGLAALIGKSLVTVVESAQGRLRYRLIETMRAYALDRLRESGDFELYAHRFARYFRSVAVQADVRYGRISNRDFLASVEADLDNFRAALEWTLAQRADTKLGAELAGALGWVYRQSSLFAEGARWCERALADNDQLAAMIAGRLYMALSFFFFNMGEMNRSLATASHATELYGSVAAQSELAWSLAQEANCLYLLGRIEDSRRNAQQAVTVARKQSDPLRLAGALNALALTVPIERVAERFEALEESIRCYRAAGDDGAIVPIANLAETHFATGNYRSALTFGREVVEITRGKQDRSNLAAALTNVAAYALALDDVDEATRAACEALTLVRDLGKTLYAMCALQHIGTAAARKRDFVRAARLSGASNRLYTEFGMQREFTEQSLYDGTLADIERALGRELCDRHFAEGEALPLELAFNEALAAATG
jgi:predicted ATPase/DNA-binding XRE family transcriptional regulator